MNSQSTDPNAQACPRCQRPLSHVIDRTRHTYDGAQITLVSYVCICGALSHVVIPDNPKPNDPYVVIPLKGKPNE